MLVDWRIGVLAQGHHDGVEWRAVLAHEGGLASEEGRDCILGWRHVQSDLAGLARRGEQHRGHHRPALLLHLADHRHQLADVAGPQRRQRVLAVVLTVLVALLLLVVLTILIVLALLILLAGTSLLLLLVLLVLLIVVFSILLLGGRSCSGGGGCCRFLSFG